MTGNTYDCPFCDRAFEANPDLRLHLLGEHRRSELTDFVVESIDRREKPTIPA